MAEPQLGQIALPGGVAGSIPPASAPVSVTTTSPGPARRPQGRWRLTIVSLCLLATAALYAGVIVVVVHGHFHTVGDLLPWLAGAGVAACLAVLGATIAELSSQRLRRRRTRRAALRLQQLAPTLDALDETARERALRPATKDLGGTVAALELLPDPAVRGQLAAGGLAMRAEAELDPGHGRWRRVSAAVLLGTLQSPVSIAPLTTLLRDSDPDVAYAAAQALAGYPESSAYTAVLDALTGDTIPAARVAGLLDSFHCPLARELIEPRADAADPRVRYWVAYLLGRLGDARSAAVVERLADDPVEDVRASAAEAYAAFADEAVLGRLLSDPSWVVRAKAATAAGVARLGGLAPQLAELLEDRSWWVRRNATVALESLGTAAVPALLAQLGSEDRFARNKAAEALVEIGYAQEQVDRFLDPAANGQREQARQFLIELGRAEALGTIVSAARSALSAQRREPLIGVLDEIGTSSALEALNGLRGGEQ